MTRGFENRRVFNDGRSCFAMLVKRAKQCAYVKVILQIAQMDLQNKSNHLILLNYCIISASRNAGLIQGFAKWFERPSAAGGRVT